MFKLTAALAAALYASLVIWGDPVETAGSETPTTPVAAASAATFDRPVILTSGSVPEAAVTRSVVAPDPAVIAAAAPDPSETWRDAGRIGEPLVVSLIEDARPEVLADTGAVLEDVASRDGMLQVTGSRVNMRSGPSTADPVVGSLPQGTLAEAMGPTDRGWVEIRDPASGLTGFMSANFLEPA